MHTFQNSGVFIANRSWAFKARQLANSGINLELDNILLNEYYSRFVIVDSDILDIGTPERVKKARELINDNH